MLPKKGSVVGFIAVSKESDLNLEQLRAMIEGQGMVFDQEQVIALMPHLKDIDAHSDVYAQVNALLISTSVNTKKYGKALLASAVRSAHQQWPSIHIMRLNVHKDNRQARTLCAALGFKQTLEQPGYLEYMHALRYKKKSKPVWDSVIYQAAVRDE